MASDSSFPDPVAEWRSTGKVWLADAVREWHDEVAAKLEEAWAALHAATPPG